MTRTRKSSSYREFEANKEICKWVSLRKHPFLLALRRWGRFARRKRPQLQRARRNGCCRRLQMDGEGMQVSHTSLQEQQEIKTDILKKELNNIQGWTPNLNWNDKKKK